MAVAARSFASPTPVLLTSRTPTGKTVCSLLLGAALLPCGLLFSGEARAQCPKVGQDTACGAVVTVNDTGNTVIATGQGPYDGSDDTLIGVVNNSSNPVY